MLVLLTLILVTTTSVAFPKAYCLGWAELVVKSGAEISFHAINCNLASFVLIVPSRDGVIVAHFDVPLTSIAEEDLNLTEPAIVSTRAELFSGGHSLKLLKPMTLVLRKNGLIEMSGPNDGLVIADSELSLVTAESIDALSPFFGTVRAVKKRTVEANPIHSLESFRN